MKTFLLSIPAILFLAISALQGQNIDHDSEKEPIIGVKSELSYHMMEANQNLRKIDILLDEKKKGNMDDRCLILGTSLVTLMDYQKTNIDSKFGYLMRHPTSANQIGTTVTEAVIHSFQLGATASVNNWISMYAEMLYDPQQSFGPGTITDLTRNQVQLRKGMVIFGDLRKFPIYGAIGKMDAPFGDIGSVNPFSNSTNWHAFGGLGFGALVGFKKHGISASFMGVQGGSQFRALHTDVKGTNVPSQLNNFVADLNYTMDLVKGVSFQAGGSYLHGSAYCTGFPIVHFGEAERLNPAYAVYGNLDFYDRVEVKTAFTKTFDTWPGSFNPNPPLDQYEASKVSSLNTGVKIHLNPRGAVKFALSGEFSNFVTGPEGSPWERQNQKILGLSAKVMKASVLFAEIFSTEGYVPLNFMTGGNMETPGETHSERDAYSNGIVVGARITL